MKITLPFVFIFLSSLSNTGQATEVELVTKLSCNVKSNIVIEIKEGKTYTYNGYKDGFKVGDSLIYELKVTNSRHGETYNSLYNVKVVSTLTGKHSEYPVIKVNSNLEEKDRFSEEILDKKRVIEVNNNGSSQFLVAGIQLELENGSSSLHLYRYYKSDWQGLGFNKDGLAGQTYTLDCREIENNFDGQVDYLIKMSNTLTSD